MATTYILLATGLTVFLLNAVLAVLAMTLLARQFAF
jgi:hypothetical protein